MPRTLVKSPTAADLKANQSMWDQLARDDSQQPPRDQYRDQQLRDQSLSSTENAYTLLSPQKEFVQRFQQQQDPPAEDTRIQQKKQDLRNRNHQSSMRQLFEDGMGAEPTIGHEVGQRMPKFGVVSKNSQKFFNRKRDQAMREGSLKLSHEEPEIVQHRGIKIVDKSNLSAFVLNAREKQHLADPDANRLFTQKLRVPSSR